MTTTQTPQTLTLTSDAQDAGSIVTSGNTTETLVKWIVANDGRALTTLHGNPVRIVDIMLSSDGTIYVGTMQQTRKGTDYVRNGYIWTNVNTLDATMADVVRATVAAATAAPVESAPAPIVTAPAARNAITLTQVKASESGVHHTVAIDDPLRAHLTRQLIKYRVQREMFCPFTGKILDIRRVVALGPIDADGTFDVKSVMHPDAWPLIKDNALKHFPEFYVWHMPTR